MITKVPVCTVVTTNTLKIYFAGSAIFTFELSTRVPSEREEYILTNATSMEDLDSSLSQVGWKQESVKNIPVNTKI